MTTTKSRRRRPPARPTRQRLPDDADADADPDGADTDPAAADAGADGALDGADAAAAPDDEDPDTAETMGPISDECPIPEPSDSVSVDVIGWEFPATAQYATEFEECDHGNLSVNVQLLASLTHRTRSRWISVPDRPEFEVMHMTNSTIGVHADNLLDLAPFIDMYHDEFDLGDISDVAWSAGTVDGRVLGVPVLHNTMHFFYNRSILEDNGSRRQPRSPSSSRLAACFVAPGSTTRST